MRVCVMICAHDVISFGRYIGRSRSAWIMNWPIYRLVTRNVLRSTPILYGTMLEPNESQPRICCFGRAERNGGFGCPLGLGTENGNGLELSSQMLWFLSQDIFSTYAHCHSSLLCIMLKQGEYWKNHTLFVVQSCCYY